VDHSPAATTRGQSASKFNGKWQKLASILGCVELDAGKEYHLFLAYQRLVDLILEGEYSC
jgi:hypothetical protein